MGPPRRAWNDLVALSTQAAPGNDVPLTTVPRTGPLAPGATYNQSTSPIVPIAAEGTRYVVVVTDADNNVVEGLGESNNRAVRAVPITVQQPPLPDLFVTSITNPSSGLVGDLVTIEWTVENRGALPAGQEGGSVWFDRVYLSLDRTIGAGDIDLGPIAHVGALQPGELYTGSAEVRLPGPPGAYFVIILTNSRGDIEEGARRDNNAVASDAVTNILQPPRPDLRVVAVVPPAPAAPGDTIEARWTVENDGDVTVTSQWVERVYASSDAAPGNDILLGSFIVGDDLEPTQQLERTRAVPAPDLTSAYHLVVGVDSLNSVDESDESNNCATAPAPSQVLRPDLVPGSVAAPAAAVADQQVTISWQVTNTSAARANGVWLDTVSMRPEGQPAAPDTLLGSFVRTNGLAAGASYPASLSVRIPGRIEGPWRFFVRSDVENVVVEGLESNNTAIATSVTAVAQPEHANLIVTGIVAPPGGLIGQSATAQWTVRNTGQAAATGSWADRLVARNLETNEETTLAEQFASGPRPVGESYTATATITYPAPNGSYRLSVITDRADNVNEGLGGGELDNRATDNATFPVSDYTVVVQTPVSSAAAGTPIPISGHAALSDGTRLPTTNAEVAVRVRNQVRTLPVTTDTLGNFAATFNPLPNEGGRYTLRAGPRGAVTFQDQDAFSIFALNATPAQDGFAIFPSTPVVRNITLSNPGDEPLTGLTATVLDATPGLAVDIEFARDSVDPLGSTAALVTADASGAPAGAASFTVRFATAQGASDTTLFNVFVSSPTPELRATPTSLVSDMIRGRQTLVEFEVRNTGGAPATGLRVLVPDSPWLSAPTPELPDLAPGEAARVVLQLLPADDLPLGTYNGAVVVSDANSTYGVSIPFSFTAASDRLTSLTVRVQDEYTYWSTGTYNPDGPLVSDARVALLDPIDQSVIAEQVTSAGAPAVFTGITESYYTVRVDAADHGRFLETVLANAGSENEVLAFLPVQTVRYTWSVTPTDIEDNAVIRLLALFETNVPVPVVTLDPPLIDLSTIEGNSAQIDLTITNHGLITAENVQLHFDAHPNWRFTPLVSDLGDLEARGTRVVPLLIERLHGVGPAPCSLNAGLTWELVCIGRNQYLVPLVFINLTPGCGSASPGGGGGGGGCFCGGNGAPGQPYVIQPTYSSPSECEPCDPKTYEPFCPIEADLSDYFAPAVAAIEEVVEQIPRISDVEVSIEAEGSLCTCCEEGGIGLEGSGSVTGTIAGTILLVGAELSIEVPITLPGGIPATLSASASAGCSLPLSGTLTGAASTGCSLMNPTASLSGEISAIVSCGVMFNGTISIPGLPPCAFNQELTINTGVSGSFNWTNGAFDWQTCFEGVYIVAGLNFTCGEHTFPGIDETIYLFPRVCRDSDGLAPPQQNDALARAMFDDLVSRLPRHTGSGAVMPRGVSPRGDGVCAQVLVQLEQRIAVTRSAFTASLTLENPSPAESLQDVFIDFDVFDAQGHRATDRFVIMPPVLTNLSGVDGAGTVPAQSIGRATWLIVPLPDAAPMSDTEYTVSGALSYRLGGLSSIVTLFPAPITVRPDPRLQLKYFWQRDVFSDDPFTKEVEPAEPFSVGLLLRNDGYGPARNVRITSGQPTIIDNDRGLIIEFELIGTQVGAEPVTPSLSVTIGDILPQQTAAVRWLLTSSLQGRFTEFAAAYEHRTSLGDPRLAIFDGLDIFQLIHVVRAQSPADDFLPDFMTNEVTFPSDPFEDPSDFDRVALPDTVHLSADNAVAHVVPVLDAAVEILPPLPDGSLRARVTAAMPPADTYAYIKFPDPFGGSVRLLHAERTNHSRLLPEFNAWQTDRSFRNGNERPARLNRVHLFDRAGDGVYTLVFAPDSNSPSVTAWAFETEHGADVGSVALQAPAHGLFVEGRRGSAAQAVLVAFSEPIDPATWTHEAVTLTGTSNLDGSPIDLNDTQLSIELLGDGSTGLVHIEPTLPDRSTYTIDISGLRDLSGNPTQSQVRTSFVMAWGDATGDRFINAIDIQRVRDFIPTAPIDPAAAAQARADVNADGIINEQDLAIVESAADAAGEPHVPDPVVGPASPWRMEGLTDLGIPDHVPFTPRTKNSRGYSIGSVTRPDGYDEATLLEPGGGVLLLGTLGGRFSVALGINELNQVVGYSETPTFEVHAFRYTPAVAPAPARMQDLGTLGGTRSWANSINDAGECVGASTTDETGQTRAFAHDGRVMIDLNTLLPEPTAWTLTEAIEITNARRVSGHGRFRSEERAFELRLVPLQTDPAPPINACPADFDRNGRVDSTDLFAFLRAFLAGDKAADFNGDQVVNSSDFLLFLNAFSSGCG